MGVGGTQHIRPHDDDPQYDKDGNEHVLDHGLAVFIHSLSSLMKVYLRKAGCATAYQLRKKRILLTRS
jgi:hypothetical protein